jgi:hypothetical protein
MRATHDSSLRTLSSANVPRPFDRGYLVSAIVTFAVAVSVLASGVVGARADALASWPWFEFPSLLLAPFIAYSIRQLGKDRWAGRTLVIVALLVAAIAAELAREGVVAWDYPAWVMGFFAWHVFELPFGSAEQRDTRIVEQLFVLLLVIPSAGTGAMVLGALALLPLELMGIEVPSPDGYLLAIGAVYFALMAWAAPRARTYAAEKMRLPPEE